MNIEQLKAKLQQVFRRLFIYRVALFLLVVLLIYAYLVLRVGILANTAPTQTAIDAKSTATQSPHIDQATVKKVEQLRDNSVNVRSLFNHARNNPFQE